MFSIIMCVDKCKNYGCICILLKSCKEHNEIPTRAVDKTQRINIHMSKTCFKTYKDMLNIEENVDIYKFSRKKVEK